MSFYKRLGVKDQPDDDGPAQDRVRDFNKGMQHLSSPPCLGDGRFANLPYLAVFGLLRFPSFPLRGLAGLAVRWISRARPLAGWGGSVGVVKRVTKMRAYPTASQQRQLDALRAAHCEIYNAALEERREHRKRHKTSVRYTDQSAQLKHVRELRPDLAVWSFTGQQQTLRRLQRSYDGFFRRLRKFNRLAPAQKAKAKAEGKPVSKPGYPRFKPVHRFDTVDHVNGDGAKWTPTPDGQKWATAYIKGVGDLKVSEHTPVEGRVTQVSVKRENNGRRWYVLVVHETDPEPLEPTGNHVGVDVGIARFLTTSDNAVVENPKFLEDAKKELAELQRRRARCVKGSGNYRRLSHKIAKLHRKVGNRRRNFHHHTARTLVDDADVIVVEDLNIGNMTRSASGTVEKPGKQVAQKRGLNRNIHDAGWGNFVSILEGKAERAGRQVIKVDPAYTSKKCHICQQMCPRPQQDTIICPTHGKIDADLNGAINVLNRAGLGSVETRRKAS